MQRSAAELLLLCDGDDVVAPGWAAAMLAAWRPGRLLCGRLDARHRDGRPVADRELERAAVPRAFGHRSYAFGGNMAVARSDLAAVGGFDERMRSGGTEIDLAFRLQDQLGLSTRYVPEAVVQYRVDERLWVSFRRGLRRATGYAFLRVTHGPQVGIPWTAGEQVRAWASFVRHAPDRLRRDGPVAAVQRLGELIGIGYSALRLRTADRETTRRGPDVRAGCAAGWQPGT